MKTSIYIVLVMVFGVFLFKPRMPKVYPSPATIKQKEDIAFKETKLRRLIDKIEYEYSKDSIEIKSIKK